MSRFLIEHLPKASACYQVAPLTFEDWQAWLRRSPFASLVRTTELISAIEAGVGITLTQSDDLMSLRPGDEAVLVTLSYGVLLAWAEGNILPLSEDWRCLSLTVRPAGQPEPIPAVLYESAVLEDEFPERDPDLGFIADVPSEN